MHKVRNIGQQSMSLSSPLKRVSKNAGKICFSWSLNDYNRMLHTGTPSLNGQRFIENKIQDLLKTNQNVHLLDIGCGQGRAMNELAEQIKKAGLEQKIKITGIDKEYQSKTKPEFTYVVGNFNNYETSDKFNLITANHFLRYVPNKLESISKIYSLLAPKGEAYVNVIGGSILIGFNGKLIPFETSSLLKDFLSSGFGSIKQYSNFYALKIVKKELVPAITFPVVFKELQGYAGQPISVYTRQ